MKKTLAATPWNKPAAQADKGVRLDSLQSFQQFLLKVGPTSYVKVTSQSPAYWQSLAVIQFKTVLNTHEGNNCPFSKRNLFTV